MASNLRGIDRVNILIERYLRREIKEDIFLKKFYQMLLEIVWEFQKYYKLPYMKILCEFLIKAIKKHRNMILKKDLKEYNEFLKDIEKLKRKFSGNPSVLRTLDEIVSLISEKINSIYNVNIYLRRTRF